MPGDDRILRSREQPRPWLIHIATASFAAFFVLLPATVFDWSGATAFVVGASLVATVIVWDIARCRVVTIAPAGLTVGARTFAWDEIESTRVREVPIARAGIFVALTDDARRRHGLPPPHYREHGFGLAPPPTPELAAQRFDVFIRAHRARLETWFALISIHQLRRMRTEMTDALAKAGLLPPAVQQAIATQTAARVAASLVISDPQSLTIALTAASIDDVLAGAARAIGSVLPESARWDPTFTGGVMVFVGPLELSNDPRAEACLEHVKAAARSQVAGTPRAIAAMFAARK